MVLIRVSWYKGFEHFSCIYLQSICLLWWRVCSSLAHSFWVVCILINAFQSSFHIMSTNSLWEMYFSNNFSKISLFILFPNWPKVWNDAHIHHLLRVSRNVFFKLYTLRQIDSIVYPLLDPFFIAADYILCRNWKMVALLSTSLGFQIGCYKCPRPCERHYTTLLSCLS